MTLQAATRKNILQGFIENGMIGKKIELYPDMDQMLATCKKDPCHS